MADEKVRQARESWGLSGYLIILPDEQQKAPRPSTPAPAQQDGDKSKPK